MTHSILNKDYKTEITIEETSNSVSINIYDIEDRMSITHYLYTKQLHDFIGILLHIQSKKRK